MPILLTNRDAGTESGLCQVGADWLEASCARGARGADASITARERKADK